MSLKDDLEADLRGALYNTWPESPDEFLYLDDALLIAQEHLGIAVHDALIEWGTHRGECAVYDTIGEGRGPCTCGFIEALWPGGMPHG